jgi:single-strand DNA-binding protein
MDSHSFQVTLASIGLSAVWRFFITPKRKEIINMMMQLVTDAVISKGYGGAPAFHSSEDGRMLSFKIGCKVYDKRADKETRWVNFNVNAFDDLAERVRRMNLKEGSHINVMGNFDMKPWVNRETGEITTWPTIRAVNIEYAASALPKQDAQTAQKAVPVQDKQEQSTLPPEQLPGFTGYEPFGGGNSYYPDET